MSVQTNVDPAKIDDKFQYPGYSKEFNLIDGHYSDFVDEMRPDISHDETKDAEKSWVLIQGKSKKEGCVLHPSGGGNADWEMVKCDIVNAHWFRNF